MPARPARCTALAPRGILRWSTMDRPAPGERMEDRSRFEEFARLATEQRNPRTLDLDTLDVAGILERISAEDRTVPEAVAREMPLHRARGRAGRGLVPRGRAAALRGRRHERAAGRARRLGVPAHLRLRPGAGAGRHRGRLRGAGPRRRGGRGPRGRGRAGDARVRRGPEGHGDRPGREPAHALRGRGARAGPRCSGRARPTSPARRARSSRSTWTWPSAPRSGPRCSWARRA